MVVEPEYKRERMGSLLTLAAPVLPLVCATKESAALVLLPVSAAKVVEGVILAGAGEGETVGVCGWPAPPQASSGRIKPIERTATNKRFVGPDFIAPQAASTSPGLLRCDAAGK